MEIIITNHVIDQYRRKTFHSISDDEIIKDLKKIIAHGRKACKRPPFDQQIYKVVYKNTAVVAHFYPKKVVIITFLGDKSYQRWYK